MSNRYTDIDASDAGVDVLKPGDENGEDRIRPGKYGLSTGANGDVVTVIGTTDELAHFIRQLTRALDEAVAHSRSPMTESDFYLDEDHDFVCNRCEASFAPGDWENFRDLHDEIREHIRTHKNQEHYQQ